MRRSRNSSAKAIAFYVSTSSASYLGTFPIKGKAFGFAVTILSPPCVTGRSDRCPSSEGGKRQQRTAGGVDHDAPQAQFIRKSDHLITAILELLLKEKPPIIAFSLRRRRRSVSEAG